MERVRGQRGYATPKPAQPIDLWLDANEGPAVEAEELASALAGVTAETLRRYPKPASIERLIAERLGTDPAGVLVTNGGDEAIDRICRAYLEAGRAALVTTPSFEMIFRYARLAQAELVETPWFAGAFPTKQVLAAARKQAGPGVIFVVTPNNPTGQVATRRDVERLSAELPDWLIVVDLAYTEFADDDLTDLVLSRPNTLAVRTFSKAYSMAGLRVGYALGPAKLVAPLRATGGPYVVSGASLAIAERLLEEPAAKLEALVKQVRSERERLGEFINSLSAHGTPVGSQRNTQAGRLCHCSALPSQANFVLARFADPLRVCDLLAGLGICVRRFVQPAVLDGWVRIGCPGNELEFGRLTHALRTALAPQAMLFDLDGVIADVSKSYRAAVIETAAEFGVTVTREDIVKMKAAGDANNDWVVTQRLLAMSGLQVGLQEVTARFEAIYQGTPSRGGLRLTEKTMVSVEWLAALRERYPLAVVTGRPRADAERFLKEHGMLELFSACVCMEDAALKPDPAPIRLALKLLGVERAWMIGDTRDDCVAARGAGVIPIGVPAPGESVEHATATLLAAGAARVLPSTSHLAELLP